MGLKAATLFLFTAFMLSLPAPAKAEQRDVARGAYLFAAAGCRNCHTDTKNKGPLLGGGAAMKTPFGIFYPPNISPHKTLGIGGWSDADFIRAMREGVSPAGKHYYPSFPYVAYTGMTDRDLLDLKAFIFSLKPVAKKSRSHDMKFPFTIRVGIGFWKMLYFRPGVYTPDPAQSGVWNRGAYLANALFHCAECHTPRSFLGGLDRDMWMAGTDKGPDGEPVPNITPDPVSGIGKWSDEEIMEMLSEGALPDGDYVGAKMADVVEYGTSKISAADQRAMMVYLKSLKSIRNMPKPAKKPQTGR